MRDADALTDSELEAFNAGFEAAFNGEDDYPRDYAIGSNEAASYIDGYYDFFAQQEARAREQHALTKIDPTDSVLALLQSLTPAEIAHRINIPLECWPGNCFAIATAIVRKFDWTEGAESVYGLYLGRVSQDCEMFHGKGAVRHGWIVTKEGVLVDPTAWVFEAQDPHVRILVPGTSMHFELHDFYDEGAESIAEHARLDFPSAGKDRVHRVPNKRLLETMQSHVRTRTLASYPKTGFTAAQLGWICRRPYSAWPPDVARALYAFVDSIQLSACVPVDYRRRCARETRWVESVSA